MPGTHELGPFNDGDVIRVQLPEVIATAALLPVAKTLIHAWQCAQTAAVLIEEGTTQRLAMELAAKGIESSLQQIAALYSPEEAI